MQEAEFKRGDGFSIGGTIAADITGWTILSQIRDGNSVLVADLTVTVSQSTPTGIFQIDYLDELGDFADTSDWAVGSYYWDVEFIDTAGKSMSSETMKLLIRNDVSRPTV